MNTVLRPLSTSELLDRTFFLYRNHFPTFAIITAIPQLPIFGLHMLDAASMFRKIINSRGLRTLVFLALGFIAIEISHAIAAYVVSDLQLSRSTSFSSAYAGARKSIIRVIGIAFVAYVVPVVIGAFLGVAAVAVSAGLLAGTGMVESFHSTLRAVVLVVVFVAAPVLSVRWWMAWSIAVPVTVLEGGGIRTSLRRSSWLTRGRRGRIFAIYLLIGLLSWTVSVIFQTPYYFLGGPKLFTHNLAPHGLAIVASALGNFFSTVMVGPLLEIALTLVYYDERVRKEGFDLQVMMAALQPQPAPAATPVS